ncbi:receptor-type tyrosine-protein phosphatase eta isoform X4 [Xenopus laevis]|uniref:protein-tyrosine-phosphatase n=1 Tax=Xenopus laevis TaxID=8355 RepID=A0A8J1MUM9_XENLA|nr:receptor-type tyrosine-protein phosphatase eta isoform X4 [Xenopus laevis]
MGQLGPLLLLLMAALLLREVTSECNGNEVAECNNITVFSKTSQITVTSPADNVTLNRVEYLNGTTVEQSVITNNTVSNLTPGSQYVIVYGNSLLNCCQNITTYPSPPGSLISNSSNTTSISLSWAQPQNMTGVEYNFNVTCSNTSGLVYSNILENVSSVQIPNLQSGTNYSIQIVTVGVMGYQSDPISISLHTRPFPVPKLIIGNITTTSVDLQWPKPQDYKSYYYYRVSVIGDKSFSNTTGDETYSITGLTPGEKYSFSVTVLIPNGTEGESVSNSSYLYPSPPGSLISNSSNTTSISLSWAQPQNMTGVEYNFNVTCSNTSGIVYSNILENVSSVQIPNLQSGTNYSIQIVTVGVMGYQSDPISISLYTRPFSVPQLIIGNITTTSVDLQWPKPQDYKSYYSYRVSVIGDKSFSNTTGDETYSITGLTPGEKYSFSVTVMIPNGTEGESVSNSSYLYPEKIPLGNITARNIRSTDVVEILWVAPPGKVEYYNISLISNNTTQMNQSRSVSPVNFHGLLPGRKFNVTILTVSGNLNQISEPLTNATYPSPPGSLISNSSNTTSISLSWAQPQNMTGVEYNFNVTCSYTSGIVYSNVLGNVSSVQIPNLQSGTSYSIQIVTVGVMGYQSDPISISLYTRPFSVPQLIIGNITTISVDLQWPKPQDYKSYYSYRVSVIEDKSFSNTTGDETYSITGLTPGEKYSFSVTVLIPNGTEGESVSNSSYLYPEKIPPGNITARNIRSTDVVEILWVAPPGKVEYYNISLISNNTTQMNQSRSVSPVNFHGLLPGRKFNVTILTVSGNLNQISEPLTNATYPSPPGSLISNSSNTTSISLSWAQPQNMTGVEYNFNVTCSYTSGIVYSNVLGNVSSVQIPNLQSGTSYSIQIVTVGVMGYQSDPISISLYTRPFPVPQLIIGNITTTSVDLQWPKPQDYKSYYSYRVSVIGDKSFNKTTGDETYSITGLTPGEKYSFSVTVLIPNGTEGESVSNSSYLYPSPPGSLISNSSSTTSISLSWAQPQNMTGVEYNFSVTYSNSSGTMYSIHPLTQSSVLISYLQSGTKYSIQIVTVGVMGYQSDPIYISLYTRPFPVPQLIIGNITTTSVDLQWPKPQDYKSYYYYRVSVIGDKSFSNTTGDETYSITGLTPGEKYSFSVTVLIPNGTEGESVSNSSYLYPERIPRENITVRNNKSTNFLEVLWVPPPGRVELYVVSLINEISYVVQFNQSTSVSPVIFRDLLPGRKFNITIKTLSGDLSSTSLTIPQATYPSPPGSLISSSSSTTSISLSWAQPQNMKGVEYNFSVTCSNTSGIVYSKVLGNILSVQIPNLQSGTSYSIQIVTVGVMGYQSDPISISLYTRPFPVPQLIIGNITTTSVDLQWPKPQDYKSYYSYRVSVIGDKSFSNTTGDETYSITGLTPGEKYSFSVTVLIPNGTEGESVSNSIFLFPAAVTSLTCTSQDGKPTLIFTWQCPEGTHSRFYLNITKKGTNDLSTINITASCATGIQTFPVDGLNYNTVYDVTITAVSFNTVSGAYKRDCTTAVGPPPIVLTPLVPSVGQVSPSQITFTFNEFNNTNGPIKAYAVIVTTDSNAVSPPSGILSKTYADFNSKNTNSYVSQIMEFGQTKGRSIRQAAYTVAIGDKSTTRGYYNGPLQPATSYKVAVAGFTNIVFDNNTNRVIEDRCSVASSLFSSPISTAQDQGVIAGAVIGSILGAAVIAILAFFIWRRQRNREVKKRENLSFSSIKQTKRSQPIPKSDFEAHFRKQQANSSLGFSEEYENFSSVGISQPKEASELPENKAKNRYNNVLPYDHSRVKLSIENHQTEDYINANYIPGYMTSKEFIAAQGPLPSTVRDFWRMIWEKNISAVVMLTRCVELGKVKCDEYWPSSGKKDFSGMSISLIEESVQPEWTIRDFTVTHKQENQSKCVRHFHFTAWPDHGVPKTTDVLIGFRNLLWDYVKQCPPNSPVLVHCSAGVGRTGTLIALDRIMKQIESEDVVDVFGTVHSLRMHRVLMVQTEKQYIFLNQCALDSIKAQKANKPDLIYQNVSTVYENCSTPLRLGNSRV